MSLQEDSLKVLRNLIRQIVSEELNEANVSSNIDGGEGPPSTHIGLVKRKRVKKRKSLDIVVVIKNQQS